MLVGSYLGTRCGTSSLSIRLCSLSASLIITCVYSRRLGFGSSCSNSCAAPRKPPKGLRISCARLRNSSELACCWINMRSSRAIRSCWSICWNSSNSAAFLMLTGVTVQVTANECCRTVVIASSCSRYGLSFLTALSMASCKISQFKNTSEIWWWWICVALSSNKISALGLAYTTRCIVSSKITAVARCSKPEKPEGIVCNIALDCIAIETLLVLKQKPSQL